MSNSREWKGELNNLGRLCLELNKLERRNRNKNYWSYIISTVPTLVE